jgi:hypothetical protein
LISGIVLAALSSSLIKFHLGNRSKEKTFRPGSSRCISNRSYGCNCRHRYVFQLVHSEF